MPKAGKWFLGAVLVALVGAGLVRLFVHQPSVGEFGGILALALGLGVGFWAGKRRSQ